MAKHKTEIIEQKQEEINISELTEVQIDLRKIICKGCKTEVLSADVKVYDSPLIDRVIYICGGCGSKNLIKRQCMAPAPKEVLVEALDF